MLCSATIRHHIDGGNGDWIMSLPKLPYGISAAIPAAGRNCRYRSAIHGKRSTPAVATPASIASGVSHRARSVIKPSGAAAADRHWCGA
jgi:hypothetical protein